VLVEQSDHLVVIEAPQHEARSLAVIEKARELARGKPIRYVVNTHAHFDHSGGLRTYVDEGAIVVTHATNRPFYEQAWSAPRTVSPDRLARSGKTPQFETFTGRHVLAGEHPIEIHPIAGNGHNDAFALVYLPAQRLLVEADAYTPAAPNTPPPAAPNPFSVNLLENIERLKLDVAQIAPLHGRLVSLRDLRAAVGRPSPAPAPENAVVETAIPGVVAAGTPIEFVAGGFDGTEGPLPLADGSLVFTENRVDRVQRIAADGSATLFSEGNLNPNALALAPDGSIIAAQTARPGIAVIHPAEKARPLATSHDGKPFGRPNDLFVDKRGGVWFTDPGPGPAQRAPGAAEPTARPAPAVYHLSAEGVLRQLDSEIARPNGIILSLDEKTLYVANTWGEHVIAYDVAADGALSRKRDFAKLAGFGPPANGNGPASSGADGLAIDAAGRLYVASSAGVQVFDARGRALGVIKLPRAPQNLAFAGPDRKTLYVVGRGAVWKIRTLAAGPAGRAK
jgi:gluconolactonase